MKNYKFYNCPRLTQTIVLTATAILHFACSANVADDANYKATVNPDSNVSATTANDKKTVVNRSDAATAASSASDKDAGAPPVLPGLEAEYYEDRDGNAIPDFIEVEMGKDPFRDDCRTNECGDLAELVKYFETPHNALLMLDSSGSMRAGNRMTKAKTILAEYVARHLPETFKTGFLVYGHKGNNSESGKTESCAGVDLLAPLGEFNGATAQATLARFEPTGWTPIAAALEKAETAFAGKENQDNRIIMVSDGLETCGGDPVAVARRLNAAGLKLRIDVVGFGVESREAQRLKEIAEAGGGEYFDARNDDQLREYFRKQSEAFNKTLAAFHCTVKNTLHQSSICDQGMTNKVTAFRLPKQINEARRAKRDDRVAALQSLSERISFLREQREQKLGEDNGRARELYERVKEFTSSATKIEVY